MLIGTYIADSVKSQDMTPLRVGSGLVQPLVQGYTKRVFIYDLGLDIHFTFPDLNFFIYEFSSLRAFLPFIVSFQVAMASCNLTHF